MLGEERSLYDAQHFGAIVHDVPGERRRSLKPEGRGSWGVDLCADCVCGVVEALAQACTWACLVGLLGAWFGGGESWRCVSHVPQGRYGGRVGLGWTLRGGGCGVWEKWACVGVVCEVW